MFSRNRLRGIAAAAALLFALPACGGDDDGDAAGPDAGDGTGGDGAGDDDGTGGDAGAGCQLDDALGNVSLATSTAEHRTQPPPDGVEPDPSLRTLLLAGAIEGASDDFLVVQLWDDFGPFVDSQLAAGEFAIEGDDASPQDCGICVNVVANVGDEDEANDRRYFATSGTVVVDSVGTRTGNEMAGNFTGTLSGVTLTELDDQTGAVVEGGCSTTIDEAAWDAAIVNGD